MHDIARVIEPLIANEEFIADLREIVGRYGGDLATLDAGLTQAETFGESVFGLNLMVVDRRIYCEGRMVDFSRRPKTLAVFRAFCRSTDGFLSRTDMVERLYGLKLGAHHSRRMVECHYNNTIKMVSRARIEATKHLGGARDLGIEWFVYDHALRGWHFYRQHPYYRRMAVVDR